MMFRLSDQEDSEEEKEKKSIAAVVPSQSQNFLEKTLSEYYFSRNTLENPLTDKFLSLAKGHYVQLMLVKEEKQREEEKQLQAEAGQARDERLASWEDIHKPKEPIDLEALFEREEKGKTDSKKLLVLGRAGIGKSTLCQYIAWCWSQGKLWNDRFDAIFWVSLRDLISYSKEDSSCEDILLWLVRERWQRDKYKKLSKQDILNYLEMHQGKILFLLDGFDEVAHIKEKETPAGKALTTLLSEDQIILTSRPDYVEFLLKDQRYRIDKCLENIGFNNDHIEKYIEHFFACHNAPEKARPLFNYLKGNANIWGIAHVPINLSLVCGIWHQTTSAKSPSTLESIQSMTGLYQRMVDALLDRYIEKHQSREAALSMSPVEQEKQTRSIIHFLSHVAWAAMQKPEGGLILEAKLMNQVFEAEEKRFHVNDSAEEKKKEVPHNTNADVFFKMIREAGFLKATGESLHKKESEKDYYFLHLTFQEYFAAKYVVEKLITLSHSSEKIEEYISAHKLNPRYEIIWRFAAGIISSYGKEAENTFWEKIMDFPRDLIGFREMNLFSHLLSELNRMDPIPIIQSCSDVVKNYVSESLKHPSLKRKTSIVRNAPQKIINEILKENLLAVHAQDRKTSIIAIIAISRITFRLSPQQLQETLATCREMIEEKHAITAFKKAIINDFLPECLRWLPTEAEASDFIFIGLAILKDIAIHKNLREITVTFLLTASKRKISREAAEAVVEWLDSLPSSLKGRGEYREYAEYKKADIFFKEEMTSLVAAFSLYIKDKQPALKSSELKRQIIPLQPLLSAIPVEFKQLMDSLLRQLHDTRTHNETIEEITSSLLRILPDVLKSTRREVLPILVSHFQKEETSHWGRWQIARLLQVLLSDMEEKERSQFVDFIVIPIHDEEMALEKKASRACLLEILLPGLKKEERALVMAPLFAQLREIEINLEARKEAVYLLEILLPSMIREERIQVIDILFSLLRNPQIASEIRHQAIYLLKIFLTKMNQVDRREVIDPLFDQFQYMRRSSEITEQIISLLELLFPEIGEIERREVMDFLFEQFQLLPINMTRTRVIKLLDKFSSEINQEDYKKVVQAVKRQFDEEKFNDQETLHLFQSLFPHRNETEQKETMDVLIKRMSNIARGSAVRSQLVDLLRNFLASLHKEIDRKPLVQVVLKNLLEEKFNTRKDTIRLLEPLFPSLNESEQKQVMDPLVTQIFNGAIDSAIRNQIIDLLQRLLLSACEVARKPLIDLLLKQTPDKLLAPIAAVEELLPSLHTEIERKLPIQFVAGENLRSKFAKRRGTINLLEALFPSLNESEQRQVMGRLVIPLLINPVVKNHIIYLLMKLLPSLHKEIDRKPLIQVVLKNISEAKFDTEEDPTHLLEPLFPSLNEAEQKQVMDILVTKVFNRAIHSAIKNLVIDSLKKLLPILHKKIDRKPLIRVVLKNLSEAKFNTEETAINLLEPLFPSMNQTEQRQVMDLLVKPLFNIITNPMAKNKIIHSLEKLLPQLSKEIDRKPLIQEVLKNLSEAKSNTREALISLLEPLFPSLNDAEQKQVIDPLIRQISNLAIDSETADKIIHLLEKLVPMMGEKEYRQIIDAGLSQFINEKMFYLLRLSFRKVNEAEQERAVNFLLTKIEMQEGYKIIRLLGTLFPIMSEKLCKQVIHTGLKRLEDSKSNNLSRLIDLLELFSPKMNEEECIKTISSLVRWFSNERIEISFLSKLLTKVRKEELHRQIVNPSSSRLQEKITGDKRIDPWLFLLLEAIFGQLNERELKQVIPFLLTQLHERNEIGQVTRLLRQCLPEMDAEECKKAINSLLQIVINRTEYLENRKQAMRLLCGLLIHMNEDGQRHGIDVVLPQIRALIEEGETRTLLISILERLVLNMKESECEQTITPLLIQIQDLKISSEAKKEAVSLLEKMIPKIKSDNQNEIFIQIQRSIKDPTLSKQLPMKPITSLLCGLALERNDLKKRFATITAFMTYEANTNLSLDLSKRISEWAIESGWKTDVLSVVALDTLFSYEKEDPIYIKKILEAVFENFKDNNFLLYITPSAKDMILSIRDKNELLKITTHFSNPVFSILLSVFRSKAIEYGLSSLVYDKLISNKNKGEHKMNVREKELKERNREVGDIMRDAFQNPVSLLPCSAADLAMGQAFTEAQPLSQAIIQYVEAKDIVRQMQEDKDRRYVAEVDRYGFTPVHYAVIAGRTNILTTPFFQGNLDWNTAHQKNGIRPAHFAVLLGRTRELEIILENKPIARQAALHYSVPILPPALYPVQAELTQTIELTPFHLAIYTGKTDSLDIFLKTRDESWEVPGLGNVFHLAVLGNQVPMLRILLSHFSGREKEVWPFLEASGPNKMTPLSYAAACNRPFVLQELLVHYLTNPNQHKKQDQFTTAIAYGICYGAVEAVQCLLEYDEHEYYKMEKQLPRDIDPLSASARARQVRRETVREGENRPRLIQIKLENHAQRKTAKLFTHPDFKKDAIGNLVFQGGGVKGIAYVGALKALSIQLKKKAEEKAEGISLPGDIARAAPGAEEKERKMLAEKSNDFPGIHRVAGTSAGAITASLVALGFSVEAIDQLLRTAPFDQFIDGLDIEKFKQSGWFNKLHTLVNHLEPNRSIWKTLLGPMTWYQTIFGAEGFCRGDRLMSWLSEQIAHQLEIACRQNPILRKMLPSSFLQDRGGIKILTVTLGDLQKLQVADARFKHLHIVAVRLPEKKGLEDKKASEADGSHIEVFNSEEIRYSDVLLIDAIRASMSIPGVFVPWQLSRRRSSDGKIVPPIESDPRYVDGGILKNYPIEHFDRFSYSLASAFAGGDADYTLRHRGTLGIKLYTPTDAKPLAEAPVTGIISFFKKKIRQGVDKIKSRALASVVDHELIQLLKQVGECFWSAEDMISEYQGVGESRTIRVSNEGIGTVDFALSREDQDKLVRAGQQAVEAFFGVRGPVVTVVEPLSSPVAAVVAASPLPDSVKEEQNKAAKRKPKKKKGSNRKENKGRNPLNQSIQSPPSFEDASSSAVSLPAIAEEKEIKPLTGTHLDVTFTFKEMKIARDGDCGFTALNIKRDNLFVTLQSRSESKESRDMLAPEIEEFLRTRTQETLADLQDDLKEISETPRHHFQLLNAARASLLRGNPLVVTKELFEAYAHVYRITKLESKLYLGYRAALLYAKHRFGNPINLYIWREPPVGSHLLTCIEHYPEGHDADKPTVHMIHTENYTHYNVLEQISRTPFLVSRSGREEDHLSTARMMGRMGSTSRSSASESLDSAIPMPAAMAAADRAEAKGGVEAIAIGERAVSASARSAQSSEGRVTARAVDARASAEVIQAALKPNSPPSPRRP